MDLAVEYLFGEEGDKGGRTLVVQGDSGTGKTFFSRELMRRLAKARPNALYLYVDVANDEYQSSRTIGSLLKLALVPGGMSQSSVVSVPASLTLERYQRQVKRRGRGRGFLKSLVHGISAFIGLGSAVDAAMKNREGAAQVEDEFAAYLAWVTKRQLVFLVIDNMQFLNLDVRLTIESVLHRVHRNLRLIVVDRTVEGKSELDPPVRCFAERLLEVQIGRLSEADTRRLVATAIGGDGEGAARLADDVFTKTDGLAKDIEYCLRQYATEARHGARAGAIEGLISTIDRLPLIHRQFLVIATLLDGGVKKEIAQRTVRRLAALYDESSLDVVVDELVGREYLRVNSESGDRLRPGHERIAIAIRDLADEELHEEVRRSLIDELATALEVPEAEENEVYLLHCLVGLQTARELSKNVHQISRLIRSQHRQDQFSYLVTTAAELHEILPLLPEHALEDLLDAMQKSSAFEQGLQLVHQLDAANVPGAAARRIHRLKYLTQAYRYDEALALAREVESGEWKDVYQVNALLALDRLDEARGIVDQHRSDCVTEAQAVMRRNAIVLFDADRALRDLDEAEAYFEREESDFRLATIETNRSLVCLNVGRYGDALRNLEKAVRRMGQVDSREIYQAQINLAVRAALRRDYRAALDILEAAALHVPRALILDQVKIDMNRCVIGCESATIDRERCAHTLTEGLRRIRGLQMPYLKRTLERNLAVARGEGVEPQRDGSDRVSLGVELPAKEGASPDAWTLLMSIHWRY